MIDWEIIGIVLLIAIPGLVTVTVSLLGHTPLEKTFATAFVLSFIALMVTINYLFAIDSPPELRTVRDVDTWLDSMNNARIVGDLCWWFSFVAAGCYLTAAIHHIWRDRKILMAKIRPER